MSSRGAEQRKRPGQRKLRAAIVGCGRVAGGYDESSPPDEVRTHARAYHSHPAVELLAVADQDGARAREFAARWGVLSAYENPRAMLAAEAPELVSVCTPDATHADILELCLGFPSVRLVWCEKPLATDLSRATALVAECERRGVLLAVNYQRRWQPQMERVKRALHASYPGRVQKVIVHYSKGILHNGSHAVDLLLDWFGFPVGLEVLGSHVDYSTDDPTLDVSVDFGDFRAYLLGADERAYSLFEIDIIGTEGRIRIESSGRSVAWYRAGSDPGFAEFRALALDELWTERGPDRTMASALEEMLRACAGGGGIRSNGESALATLQLCCMSLAAARERGKGLGTEALTSLMA